jgi:hypothetical protein
MLHVEDGRWKMIAAHDASKHESRKQFAADRADGRRSRRWPQIAQMAADRADGRRSRRWPQIAGRLRDAGAAVYCEREKDGQQSREQDRPADTAGPGAQHGDEASLDLVLMDC